MKLHIKAKVVSIHDKMDVLDESVVDEIVALFVVITHIIALRQETATLPVNQSNN